MLKAAALLATLALPAPSAAQDVAIKAGVNFATFAEEEDESQPGTRRGLTAGLAVRVPVGGRFSIQLEGLLSDKGASFDFGSDRLRYIEGPVLGRVDFSAPGASVRPFALTGVAPAFRLNAGATRADGTSSLDRIRAFDIGWVAGAGFEAGRILLEARYTRGLRPLDTPDGHDHPARRNRVFSVLAGYLR